jgi:hypothetical protein
VERRGYREPELLDAAYFNERRNGVEMLLMRGLIAPDDYRRRMSAIDRDERAREQA